MKLAITGAKGLLGTSCVAEGTAKGHDVLVLTSHPQGSQEVIFRLGEAMDSAKLRGVDALIHCAYDFEASGRDEVWQRNVEGSMKLFTSAVNAGVKQLVFISSVSAFLGCKSLYGQGKLAVEEHVLSLGGIVIRPGLIWGSTLPRGMMTTLGKLTKLPLIPMMGGKKPMVLVHVEDLARTIVSAAEGALPKGWYTAAAPEPMRFEDIMKKLAAGQGRSPMLVPIPIFLVYGGLKFLEILGINPPFRSDSLIGLVYPNPDFYQKLPIDRALGHFRQF